MLNIPIVLCAILFASAANGVDLEDNREKIIELKKNTKIFVDGLITQFTAIYEKSSDANRLSAESMESRVVDREIYQANLTIYTKTADWFNMIAIPVRKSSHMDCIEKRNTLLEQIKNDALELFPQCFDDEYDSIPSNSAQKNRDKKFIIDTLKKLEEQLNQCSLENNAELKVALDCINPIANKTESIVQSLILDGGNLHIEESIIQLPPIPYKKEELCKQRINQIYLQRKTVMQQELERCTGTPFY